MARLTLALAALLAADPVPRALRVPSSLTAVTRAPEPSGLVWNPPLQRYLVVSDDTGRRDLGTSHRPMLLALGADGELDATPLPITGIERLDDAEAICAAPGGALYLVTSHAPNRKGRTPPARRQLLRLALRGRGLAVEGRLDLTALEGPPLADLAGLDPTAPLDVEGLAWHGGALYIGLKSPLTSAGKAVILRLATPDDAFRASRIPDGALSRWAEVPLCPPGRGARVCQGIAELLFLADGSLLVAANAPKAGPADGGGGVWWIGAPGAAPILLRRFPGLKPEGLALTPGGGRVVVVFDTGEGQEPLWTELTPPQP